MTKSHKISSLSTQFHQSYESPLAPHKQVKVNQSTKTRICHILDIRTAAEQFNHNWRSTTPKDVQQDILEIL
jgi:hypothetical protein